MVRAQGSVFPWGCVCKAVASGTLRRALLRFGKWPPALRYGRKQEPRPLFVLKVPQGAPNGVGEFLKCGTK